jgi:hypothetical protein
LLYDKSKPIKFGKIRIPRLLKHYSIEKNKELGKYMEIMRAKEAKYCKDEFGIKLKYKKP